jgi:hypothetical protein
MTGCYTIITLNFLSGIFYICGTYTALRELGLLSFSGDWLLVYSHFLSIVTGFGLVIGFI